MKFPEKAGEKHSKFPQYFRSSLRQIWQRQKAYMAFLLSTAVRIRTESLTNTEVESLMTPGVPSIMVVHLESYSEFRNVF